ncbi:MAG: AMP-dependent synthetase/ligase [Pyrinomonadaceae bacterium]
MKNGGIEIISSPRRAIGRGKPLYADEPKTLGALFRQAADRYPNTNLLNFKRNGRWESIGGIEMLSKMRACAAGLSALGIQKGDRVAILAPNSPEWTITDGACQLLGVIDVPIYTTLAPASIKYILQDSGARVLCIDNQDSFERLKESIEDIESLEKIVLFQGNSLDLDQITFDKLLSTGDSVHAQDESKCLPDDIATLIYSSGTTGEPKGVILTHNCILSNVVDAGEKYDFATHDVPLSVLPLSHIFERSAMYLYIYHGMSVHYAESVDKVPDNLAEVRPTIFVGVPRIFEKVYARAKLNSANAGGVKETIFDWAIGVAKKYQIAKEKNERISFGMGCRYAIADRLVFSKLRGFFGGRLRACITGGAALTDDIYLIFNGAGIPVMQGYGLTETSPVLTSNNPEFFRLGSVGKPIRNVKVRIADDGEIETTGPGVMLGYYHKPEATRDAFTIDGWFRTGDIGHLDDDGFLFVTDRKKELFKTSGGKYIAPSPIEQMIRASRFVTQAVLIGNERRFASALIVPNFEMLESYAQHKGFAVRSPADFCRDPRIIDLLERQVASHTKGLARFETVKKIALIENEFSVEGGELTPTLKVRRRIIDEKYKDLIEQLYAV